MDPRATGRAVSDPLPYTLPMGTRLWRVHRAQPVTRFADPHADAKEGTGRFDYTPEDRFSYLYAAFSDTAALAETLLRNLLFDHGRPTRLLRWDQDLRGRRLSAMRTTRDLRLISLLSAPELARARNDPWILHAEANLYPYTRAFAAGLRQDAPWAQGLVWLSNRDLPSPIIMLYGDRCGGVAGAPVVEIPGTTRQLDHPAEFDWLNAILAPYRAQVDTT